MRGPINNPMARHFHKKSPLPAGSFPAPVEALAHDGRGIAHPDGKTVFIQGALPAEKVTFHYTARHSQYDEGRVDTVLDPAPDRAEPRCAHFGVCGGCSLQHLEAGRQIAFKQDWLLDNLARIGRVEPEQLLEPLTGPPWGYRRKARLGVRHVAKKGRVLVGFHEQARSFVTDVRRCEVLHPKVGERVEELAHLIGQLSLYNRLPQIEVAAGDAAVALSFRVLAPPSEADKALLTAFGQRHDIWIYLQPGGPETTCLLWPQTETPLYYRLPEFDVELAFMPYHFIQVNAEINRRMVGQAVELLDLQDDERVLDLFCGLGNFTLALARRARQAVGVEGDRRLVEWAEQNARRNGIQNVRFFAADLTGAVQDQPWMQERYAKVLLDPPRSGALEMLPPIAALGAQRVVYVSCHPATLARDAGELVHRFGYKLLKAGVMDMFPHTAHVESIALFER